MKLQRLGGYAAIAGVCAMIARFAFKNLVAKKHFGEMTDPAKRMAAGVSAALNDIYVVNLLLIVGCIFLLIVVLALHERMQAKAPYLTRIMLIAAAVGTAIAITDTIVWIKGLRRIAQTQDVSVMGALTAIKIGLDATAIHAAGWARLFIGCAILRTRAFSRALGWLCLLTGILEMAYFMISQVGAIASWLTGVSIVWIGIALLWQKQPQPASEGMAASR